MAESRAHTHTPALIPNKSKCTLTSDSSTSSPRELCGAFPATRARQVVLFLLRLRFIYLFTFPSPLSVTFTPRALSRRVAFAPS